MSHVLRAMKLPDERIRGALRFSFGRFNTNADVDAAVTIVTAAIAKLRAMSPRSFA
jgi:cysteine desulfurase